MTAAERCDYRYGWRWLVPSLKGRSVLLVGAIGDDAEWWRETVPSAEFGTTKVGADAWIVDADLFSRQPDDDVEAMDDGVRFVCVVGKGARVGRWKRALRRRFPVIREYGLLPREAPRVVVPLGAYRRTAHGLLLHRPGRRRLRLLVGVASVLASFGLDHPLRWRVLLIASEQSDATPQGVVDFDLGNGRNADSRGDFALYLGTADERRKTVVLPLRVLPPRQIFKTAVLPAARRSLENEAHALESLAETPLASMVPSIECRTETRIGSTLGLEYRPSTHLPSKLVDMAAVRFLARLHRLENSVTPFADLLIADVLARLSDDTVAHDDAVRVRRWLVARAESGAKVQRVRTHGDFAPWNCAWTGDGLFVFDWERSEPAGVALGDAFHYRIAPPLAAGRRLDVRRLGREATAFAARVRDAAGLRDIDVQLQLAAWALERVKVSPFFLRLLVETSHV